ncbi:AMIN-like domain-containing (lipo)protein [Streptomyces lavendulocolor]|uniref:AMIN-like domain-containing (lipo)protein n=1 Tax=Streptomyces lavendulocolor TaxID=67316 RepID=UPI003C2D1FD7
MKRRTTALATLLLTGAGLGLLTVPAQAATTAAPRAAAVCPTGWGSAQKTAAAAATASLRDIRTGRHECFDRMVFHVPGVGSGRIGYDVRYVSRLYQDGSGRHVPVAGGAVLEVRVTAPSYDPETGGATYRGRVAQPLPGVNLTGYRTFKDTRFAGSFEGDTQVGIGVRARLPYRVLQLPDRLVVDVAHTWGSTAR